MSDIKTLKLSTGEDIVATILGREDNVYLLKDAIVLHQVPAGEGKMQIAVLRFLPYSDKMEHFELVGNFVMTETVPSAEIMDQYNAVFSDIITPQKQKIVV